MVDTIKFSEFSSGGNLSNSDVTVGVKSGANVQFTNPWTFLPSGTTADRPAIVPEIYNRLRFNTDLGSYEFYDSVLAQWTQLEDSGDINDILALLASNTVNQGASLIGLQDQAGVTTQTVQDLANASIIAQTDNGTLTNGQFLGELQSGALKNTTTTGVLSISNPLTEIDELVVTPGDMLYVNADSEFDKIDANTVASEKFLTQTGTGVIGNQPIWTTLTPAHITGVALTRVNDTNVTLTLGGSPTTALLAATSITAGWTGLLAGTRGGTGVDNGSNTATFAGNLNFANSFTTSGNFAVTQTYTGVTSVTFPTSGTLATTSQIPSGSPLTAVNDTNVTLTLGDNFNTALVNTASITAGWTGNLAVSRGGTGTGTAFTAGSIVFAGASGVYTQDNTNLFWDDSNNRLGIKDNTPSYEIDVDGRIRATTQILCTSSSASRVTIGSSGIDIQDSSNPFLDFKTDSAEDYDCRIEMQSNGFYFYVGGQGSTYPWIISASNGTTNINTNLNGQGLLTLNNEIDNTAANSEIRLSLNDVTFGTWFSNGASHTVPNIMSIRNVKNSTFSLGANNTDYVVINPGGEVTNASQPAFSAYLGTTDSNVTGTGTAFQLGSGNALTEVFDQGSDFNTNGTFTAPVTGRYFLQAAAHVIGCTVATDMQIQFVTSNRTWVPIVNGRTASAANWGLSGSVFCDMDAGDTATVNVAILGEAADTADIYGNANPTYTFFTGYLVC